MLSQIVFDDCTMSTKAPLIHSVLYYKEEYSINDKMPLKQKENDNVSFNICFKITI